MRHFIHTIGWGAAFAAAGVGMFIGVITFITGTKHYKAYDVRKPLKPGDMPLWKILALVIVPSIIFGVIGWFIKGGRVLFLIPILPMHSYLPVFLLLIFYTVLLMRSSKDERPAMGAMLSIFAVVILFWAIFKQNGSALNTWASRYTDRQVSGTTGNVLAALKQTDKPVNTTYK